MPSVSEPASSEPTDTNEYPVPFPHSGQKRGETLEAFFERRLQEDKKLADKETRAQTTSRKQRQAHNDGPNGQQMPGRGSKATIFVWEQDETMPNYWMRKRITKNEWEDAWENRKGQRRYNAFRNEWDICSQFGPDAERWENDDEPHPYDEAYETLLEHGLLEGNT